MLHCGTLAYRAALEGIYSWAPAKIKHPPALVPPSLVFPPPRERQHKLYKIWLSQVTLALPSALRTSTGHRGSLWGHRHSWTSGDPQYQVLQAQGKPGQPAGKAALAFAGAVMILGFIPSILTCHTEWQHNHLDSSRLFLTRCISIRNRKKTPSF